MIVMFLEFIYLKILAVLAVDAFTLNLLMLGFLKHFQTILLKLMKCTSNSNKTIIGQRIKLQSDVGNNYEDQIAHK